MRRQCKAAAGDGRLAGDRRNAMCSHAFSRATGKPRRAADVTIPNLITIGRLCLVPLIVWLILAPHPLGAFVVFLLAAASDAVDGILARQLDLRSDLGAYLDPIADKALLVSVYVALAALDEYAL